jgi:hypothetical protein
MTFLHPLGKLVFPIDWGLFCVEDNRLTFSLECKSTRESYWMSEPLFGLADYPLKRELRTGMTIRHERNVYESVVRRKQKSLELIGPRAFVYAGNHHEPYDVRVKFERVGPKTCDINMRFMMPDVRRYGRGAKDHAVSVKCRLQRGDRGKMWVPD